MIRKLFTVIEKGEFFTNFCIPVRKYFVSHGKNAIKEYNLIEEIQIFLRLRSTNGKIRWYLRIPSRLTATSHQA